MLNQDARSIDPNLWTCTHLPLSRSTRTAPPFAVVHRSLVCHKSQLPDATATHLHAAVLTGRRSYVPPTTIPPLLYSSLGCCSSPPQASAAACISSPTIGRRHPSAVENITAASPPPPSSSKRSQSRKPPIPPWPPSSSQMTAAVLIAPPRHHWFHHGHHLQAAELLFGHHPHANRHYLHLLAAPPSSKSVKPLATSLFTTPQPTASLLSSPSSPWMPAEPPPFPSSSHYRPPMLLPSIRHGLCSLLARAHLPSPSMAAAHGLMPAIFPAAKLALPPPSSVLDPSRHATATTLRRPPFFLLSADHHGRCPPRSHLLPSSRAVSPPPLHRIGDTMDTGRPSPMLLPWLPPTPIAVHLQDPKLPWPLFPPSLIPSIASIERSNRFR